MLSQPPSPNLSKQDFADQVRSERLSLIWKATGFVLLLSVWFFILFDVVPFENFILPSIMVLLASFGCRYFLQQQALNQATWVYAVGLLLAIGALMLEPDEGLRELMPFTALIILFTVGLLMPARAMLPLSLLAIAVILLPPWIGDGALSMPTSGAWLAMMLVILTALITAQASGELYSIAEWALESYRREREGAQRIYESRQEVEKSFLRQRALTEEIKQTNDELAEARQAAEEAKHFRGQFLANMSHELRTPLNAVIGFSDTMLNFPMMYDNVELPDEYRKDLSQINSSGKHLLSIINDILDLSKIDAGRLEIEIQEVELEPIFKGVMSTAIGLVGGKPIKMTRNTPNPDAMPKVLGDPVRIRQVLLNLYSNAAKFTSEGHITLTMTDNGQEAIISLTDTGEGIPPGNEDIIFEEFRQAAAGRKQARAGAGLGLAISRQLLSLMGGRIWVESVYGQGSTFSFSLPLAHPASDNILQTDTAETVVSEA